jgi:hypothetical protein
MTYTITCRRTGTSRSGKSTPYYDFGFDPLRALRAAARYGVSQGKAHAWPNGEAAWYGTEHRRGTYLLDQGAYCTPRDVALSDLRDSLLATAGPPIYDIAKVWRAAHAYARANSFETALPTFEPITVNGQPGIRLICLGTGQPWLVPTTAPITSPLIYEKPDYSVPASVIRNVHRWALGNGYQTAFPTFVPDTPNDYRRPQNAYNVYGLTQAAPITWRDVPTPTYIQQL